MIKSCYQHYFYFCYENDLLNYKPKKRRDNHANTLKENNSSINRAKTLRHLFLDTHQITISYCVLTSDHSPTFNQFHLMRLQPSSDHFHIVPLLMGFLYGMCKSCIFANPYKHSHSASFCCNSKNHVPGGLSVATTGNSVYLTASITWIPERNEMEMEHVVLVEGPCGMCEIGCGMCSYHTPKTHVQQITVAPGGFVNSYLQI